MKIDWVWSQEERCWKTPWATVWKNGTWHTWDEDGVGGENGIEENAETAKAWAIRCAIRQGFFRIDEPERKKVWQSGFVTGVWVSALAWVTIYIISMIVIARK